MAPFTGTILEASESPDAEEGVDDIDDPEELPIWGHLASSVATRLAGPTRMLSVLLPLDCLVGLPKEGRASSFRDACRPIPRPRVPLLKRDVLAWLKGGNSHDPAYLCDAAPEDIPDFHLNVSIGLCPLEGYGAELEQLLLSSGENRFETEDFCKCKFMLLPDFAYWSIGDGAGFTIFHREELTNQVREAARRACHDLGMEWKE